MRDLLALLRDVRLAYAGRLAPSVNEGVAARLDAAIAELEAQGQEPDYGPGRCEVCGWTLADSAKNG